MAEGEPADQRAEQSVADQEAHRHTDGAAHRARGGNRFHTVGLYGTRSMDASISAQ
jgi:hypothetical protein